MTMSWESETWSEIRESWPRTHQIHWIGGLKKNSLACFILGSRLWQARMQRERYFVFPFFLLDPALDRFSDLLFIPKQDKKPQREEIKDENSCCSFWFPEPRIDLLSYLRTRSRMLRLLLHPSTATKLREGGDSLHLTSPRHLKPFMSVCFYTKIHTLGFSFNICEHYLRLSSDGCHIADLFRPQCVDDWTLSHIRVADETHTDLFLVCVELSEAENRKWVFYFRKTASVCPWFMKINN